MTVNTPSLSPVSDAALRMFPRLGSSGFQIRYSDEPRPVVWLAVAEFTQPSGPVHEAAAGLTPDIAIFRLLETLLDGGQCTRTAIARPG